MSDLPRESERLFAVAPEEFVAERNRLARELRAAGRSQDALTVAALRKPSAVVLAVNRAARSRPQAAQDGAAAAVHVRETQLAGEPDAYRQALEDLGRSLDMLAEVAIAHVVPRGRRPSDTIRRRVHDLLRSAVADDDGRAALARGVLTDEREAAGFTSFAGIAPMPERRKQAPAKTERSTQRTAKERAQEKALRDELTRAERELRAAQESVRKAVREQEQAEKAVAAARAKLDRLGATKARERS